MIVTSSGATLKGGGTIKITDLWSLPSDKDIVLTTPSWAASSIEFRKKLMAKLKEQNDAT